MGILKVKTIHRTERQARYYDCIKEPKECKQEACDSRGKTNLFWGQTGAPHRHGRPPRTRAVEVHASTTGDAWEGDAAVDVGLEGTHLK